MSFAFRTMRREDLDVAVEWAAREGWNPGLHDADAFFACDPSGYLIGELDDEPVSCISCVAYPDDFGFIGFYIVRPEHRGRGYGLRTWSAALEYLGDCNIGLDGVVEQQANYARSGFKLAYRNIRYSGTSEGSASDEVVDASDLPFARLEAYDRQHFPSYRTDFLKRWLRQPAGSALVAIRNGKTAGYGVIRACRSGHKIGPLFADDEAIADVLYQSLAARVPGAPVFLDVPEPNRAALTLAERHGLKPVFETARMYTKQAPDVPLERVFGVTTFELG